MEGKASVRWPLFVVVTLLLVVTVVFVIVFVSASVNGQTHAMTSEDYTARVAELLLNADAARGEALISSLDCQACHIAAAGVGIAPPFEGVAARAETRRPPLTAAEYLYESIVKPTAFVVEGFAGSMPQNYAQRLSDEQLGDIITYLLTLD